jgi:hypothetical protein
MAFSRSLAIRGLLGAGLFGLVGACGEDPPPSAVAAAAGQGGAPVQVMDSRQMSGRAAAGSAGSVMPSAGAAAGGIGGHAGNAGNGGAGQAAMGAGNAGGGMAGIGGIGGSGAAGAPAEDDFFGGLFDPPAPDELSCEGLLCFEAADCASLYPDETAACKFTRCEDFACK